MDTKSSVEQVFQAFKLGNELAESFRDGLYSELDTDDLGSLIAALICQRVLRGDSSDA